MSSRRKTKRKGCAGKQGYPSLLVALAQIAEAQDGRGEILEAYHCDRCGLHHVGHPRRARANGRLRRADFKWDLADRVIPPLIKGKPPKPLFNPLFTKENLK